MLDFICPGCDSTWTLEGDEDGLVDGYGLPPCPTCGTTLREGHDYGDWACPYCDNHWRAYGNGGLSFGMVPACPKCGTVAVEA